jgi:hypothetical protein
MNSDGVGFSFNLNADMRTISGGFETRSLGYVKKVSYVGDSADR